MRVPDFPAGTASQETCPTDPAPSGAIDACHGHGGCDGARFSLPDGLRPRILAWSPRRPGHGRLPLSLKRDPSHVTVSSRTTVFVLGGARSGKSAFAEGLIRESGLFQHYIATGQAWDEEMKDRIAHHRATRGDGWVTHEDPLELVDRIRSLDHPDNAILVDCLTLWLTNLMMAERDIARESALLADAIATLKAQLVLVSNEVGLGIVPENRMAREFRDHAGRLHQMIAARVAEVYFVAAGLPLRMKG